MTTMDDLDDLLPDDLLPSPKGAAKPLARTQKQIAAAAAKAERDRLDAERTEAETRAEAAAKRLAQVVNLTIAGYSYDEIGAAIGATGTEVERMLNNDVERFVRNQSSLRVWVRKFVSGKYLGLLDSVYDEATDKNNKDQLEYHVAAVRVLERMAKLHGADMPTQSEVKVEAKPEAVEELVKQLAAGRGLGYDAGVFDVVPGEVIHKAAQEAPAALERAERDMDNDRSA